MVTGSYTNRHRLERSFARRVFYVVLCVATSLFVFLPATSYSQRKSCVDCHDKVKDQLGKKNVHTPAKESCETCHKRHGFQQKLILVKGMPDLCIDCHEDVQSEISGENVHAALPMGGCSVCHDPHASNNDALMRDTEGERSACLTCHADLEITSDGEAHKPFSEGRCSSCHEPHSSENRHLLIGTETAVCASCHEGAAAKHDVPGFDELSCSDCHNPHLSSKKAPLSKSAHEPFAEGDCSTCHTVVDGNIGIADNFPPGDLCLDCHDQVATLMGGSESHFGATGLKDQGSSSCIACHDPHRTIQPSLLTRPENDLCRSCHDDLPQGGNYDGTVHHPFEAGQCTSCHTPHGGGGPTHFARSGNGLCATCHEDLATATESGFRHEAMEVAECLDCHSGHATANEAVLLTEVAEICAECHDSERHSQTHVPYQTASCRSCHRNHSTESALLKTSVNETCLSCHKELTSFLSAAFTHEPVREEDCLSCHVAHGGEAEGLLSEPQRELCTTCHDLEDLVTAGDQGTSAPQFHTAIVDGQCSDCHNPHGSPIEKLLNRDKEQICYSCHTQERVAFSEGYTHTPVADGRCDQCHAPHGSANDHLRVTPEPDLCTRCHDFSQPAAEGLHQKFDLSTAQCSSCHAPHSSSQPKILNPVVHYPFDDRDCEACHDGIEEGMGADAFVASADAESCLMCHDDKEDQDGHHRVEGIACQECHTPHSSRFDALLINPGKLCLGCHEDLFHAEGDGPVRVHRPIEEGSCLECHELHDAAAKSFLAKSQQDLCSGCHKSIESSLSHATKHNPFAKGDCSGCHETHASTENHLLVMSEETLCVSCHGLTTAKMTAAHTIVPLQGGSCTSCHDPHSTEEAGSSLLHPNQHYPYEERECDACHEPSGSVVESNLVCADCHDNDQGFELTHKGGHSGANGRAVDVCLDCHSPHVGHESLLARDTQQETCLTCHDRREFNRATVHGAVEQGCTTCHELHTNNIADLRDVQVNQLCIDCHEEEEKEHLHPIGANYKDPRTGGPLTCVGCHEPHSSDFDHMLTFDRRRALCIQCHAAGTMRVH